MCGFSQTLAVPTLARGARIVPCILFSAQVMFSSQWSIFLGYLVNLRPLARPWIVIMRLLQTRLSFVVHTWGCRTSYPQDHPHGSLKIMSEATEPCTPTPVTMTAIPQVNSVCICGFELISRDIQDGPRYVWEIVVIVLEEVRNRQ